MPQAGATELGLPSQEQSHPQHGFAEPTSMEESNIMRDSDSDSHSINQIRAEIEGSNLDPKRIVMRSPKERFKLSYIDTMCLIINRIIGTGIFVSPGKTLAYTTSVGASLLLWVFGIFYALAGAHVYTELGLSIPRYIIDNVEQSVPRSGGDLNYVSQLLQLISLSYQTNASISFNTSTASLPTVPIPSFTCLCFSELASSA